MSILVYMQSFKVRGFNLEFTRKKVTQSVRTLEEHLLELKKLALGNANAYEAQRAPLARSTFLWLSSCTIGTIRAV